MSARCKECNKSLEEQIIVKNMQVSISMPTTKQVEIVADTICMPCAMAALEANSWCIVPASNNKDVFEIVGDF